MAGIILLAIVFYTCKKNTMQASINSPENRVSNFIQQENTNFAFTSENTYTEFNEDSPVNWITFDEAYIKCKKNPRPIMIDIYTTWCGPCKMMSKQTFNHPTIAKYINDNFYDLTETVMSSFADEARLLILNSIGSTAGTAVTGVATFSQFENKPEITLGLSPFEYIFTWAGI